MQIIIGRDRGCFSHEVSAHIPESILTDTQKQLFQSFLDAKDELAFNTGRRAIEPGCYIKLWAGDHIEGEPTAFRAYDMTLLPEDLRPLFVAKNLETYKI